MSDPFRATYRELTFEEKERVKAIKEGAHHLYELISPTGPTSDLRYIALARTALEEAVMWATKAFT